MVTPRVLVAFASEQGSTAEIARLIARTLRERGLDADCLPATSVDDVTPYEGVVLGSGVFLPRHGSDGQGFLARHAATLRGRRVWLFASGPLGRVAHARGVPTGAGVPDAPGDDSPLARVAREVGARGQAAFGAMPDDAVRPGRDADARDRAGQVRRWADAIAADLEERCAPGAAPRAVPRCPPVQVPGGSRSVPASAPPGRASSGASGSST